MVKEKRVRLDKTRPTDLLYIAVNQFLYYKAVPTARPARITAHLSGTTLSKILHNGSQPSLTLKKNS